MKKTFLIMERCGYLGEESNCRPANEEEEPMLPYQARKSETGISKAEFKAIQDMADENDILLPVFFKQRSL